MYKKPKEVARQLDPSRAGEEAELSQETAKRHGLTQAHAGSTLVSRAAVSGEAVFRMCVHRLGRRGGEDCRAEFGVVCSTGKVFQ